MVLLCFLWFSVLFFASYRLFKSDDNLAPLKFVSLKYALLNLPFILFIYFNPRSFFRSILKVCDVTLDDAFLQYTIVQTVAYASLIAGIYFFLRKSKGNSYTTISTEFYSYKYIKIIALVFALTGIGAYGVFIYRIGGIVYLLANLDKRVEMQSGQYVLQLLNFLSFSVLLFMLCIKLKNNVWDKILFWTLLVLSCLIFSSFGARKNTLILIIMVLVSYHYTIKNLRFSTINKPLIAILALLLSLYILVVPVLRQKDGINKMLAGEINYARSFNIKFLLYNVSYTYIDVFTANYFNQDNIWKLSGFTDPVTVFLTKGDKASAPPVDQGVYFWNIVKNKKYYRPPVSRGEMDKNSWPIENFGFGFANFWYPGIIIAFFLQGIVFAFVYTILKKEIYNPVLIYMYVFVVFNFNFSNLRLVQLATTLPLALVCYYLLFIVRKNKFASGLN